MATEILPGFASELTAFEQAADSLKAAGYVQSGNASATYDGSDTRLFLSFDGAGVASAPPADVIAYKEAMCQKMKEKDKAKQTGPE